MHLQRIVLEGLWWLWVPQARGPGGKKIVSVRGKVNGHGVPGIWVATLTNDWVYELSAFLAFILLHHAPVILPSGEGGPRKF